MAFDIQRHKEIVAVETLQDSSLGIMKWGSSNSFPQTLLNIINQSALAKPATERTSKFYRGSGFEGEDTIINKRGLTLGNLVNINSQDLSVFKAFAIHCNYNLAGEVTSFVPMRITDLRFNCFDELNYASKIGYHENFGLNSEVVKTVKKHANRGNIKWFDRFNPTKSIVLEQIEKAGGLSKYNGQILYYSEAGHSNYPIPPLQAPINYVLADVENGILIRKETSTGFINTYLLKTTMSADDVNLIALENAIQTAQGARGSGKVITMPDLSPDDVSNTLLEEIGGGAQAKAIIDSAASAYDLSERIINGAYLIPPILAGADTNTGFSSDDLKDAYFVFNAITQEGRQILQSNINRIIKHSTLSDKIEPIKIKRLSLDVEVEGEPVVEPIKTEGDV